MICWPVAAVPWLKPDWKPGNPPAVRAAADGGQAAHDADGAGREEGGEVVAVHLVAENAFADLVEGLEAERDVAAVRQDDAVEADREAVLVLAADGLRGAYEAAPPGG